VLNAGTAAGLFSLRTTDINSAGGELDSNAEAGLGRVGISIKREMWDKSWLAVAVAEELSLPSPSSQELAGTDSFGALSRLILAAPIWRFGRIHCDGGYEFDSQFRELWRGVWNIGASTHVGQGRAMIDIGFGGSVYLKPLDWSPQRL